MKLAFRIRLRTGLASLSSVLLRALIAILLACVPVSAAAEGGGVGDIWICVDAETGAKTFTSNPRGLRQCRRADQTAGARSTKPAPGSSNSSGASGAKPAVRASAPTQVASAQQRQRESDRKQILQDELASENKKYAELQREFNLGAPIRLPGETDDNKYRDRKLRMSQDIERSRVNIRSLERELERQ